MSSKVLPTLALISLVLMAAAQSAMLWQRQNAAFAANGGWLGLGDDLTPLKLEDSSGEARGIPSGTPTVLLIFDPACSHSERVTQIWASWIRSQHGLRALAISNAEPSTAEAYGREHGWGVEVLSVRSDSPDWLAITRRTPWVFLVDKRGIIVSEGHGSRISEITTSVSSVSTLAEAR